MRTTQSVQPTAETTARKKIYSFFSFPNRKRHKYGLAIAGTDLSFGIHAQIELWQFPIYLLSISLEICAHVLLIPLCGKQFIKCAYEFHSESQRKAREHREEDTIFGFVRIFEWCSPEHRWVASERSCAPRHRVKFVTSNKPAINIGPV